MTDHLDHIPPASPSDTPYQRSSPRVSTWLTGGTGGTDGTGDFLGYATLAGTTFVVLHPSAARSVLAQPVAPQRLRVVVDTRRARYVVDGDVRYGNEGVPGTPVAVELDFPIAEEPTRVPLPADDEDPAQFTALDEFLQAAQADDPAEPPARPAGLGYERLDDMTSPAKQPPWCRLWPGCWGCR